MADTDQEVSATLILPAMSHHRLDIVIPIANEQEVLETLYARIIAACETLTDIDWRVISVNDGSKDASLAIAREQCRRDPRFALVDLSRNFGHQAAIAAGLSVADADAVVVMDGDLQDPPEVIPRLVEAWRTGAQVVLAKRRSRQDRGLRRMGMNLFHKVFARLSDVDVATDVGVFSLMDRQAVCELNRLTERNRFFPGLSSWIGFEPVIVHYDRAARLAGSPKQPLEKLVRYALDGIFGFSYKPLRLMTFLGTLISLSGFSLALYYVGKRLIGVEQAQMGFTTLVALTLLLGGSQLIALGMIGEYMARIYDEVKNRPLYVVRRTYNLGPASTGTESPSGGVADRAPVTPHRVR